MSLASSSTTPRALPTRSLPALTVFSHPAARLVKTVPQLQPPVRVNGHVPLDTLGAGRASPSDVILTDVSGPLSILVVPDPLDPTIATLVLSVGFQDASLQGAARRFVLPFRSFQRDPVSGQLISESKIKSFDAANRTLYPGLGAGLKGLDGGSFWFFEDIGEEGAFDRFRWEKDGVGRRAIWTVWLISTPASVVLHVQNLLQAYPAPVPSLPPWLKDNNGFPWKDSYVVLPPPAHASLPMQNIDSPKSDDSTLEEHDQSTAKLARRPLPAIPPVPIKPVHLDTDGSKSSTFTSKIRVGLPNAAVTASEITQVASTSSDVQPTSEASLIEKSSVGPADGSDPERSTSRLSVRSRRLHDGSSSVTIGDAPDVVLRDVERSIAVPEYRNSLVAVDNLTGQIISVLASNINLESPSVDSTKLTSKGSADSSEEAEADLDDEDDAQTPLDEPTKILTDKSPEVALGLLPDVAQSSEAHLAANDDQDDLVTPRPSTFEARALSSIALVRRASSFYRDAAAERVQSRAPSILADDTFSPPPLPPKQPELLDARDTADTSADAPPSRRTSTASAAFFSAESDADAMSRYDSDAFEIDARSITHDNISTSFISIQGRASNHIETHRPELLQDAASAHNTDEGAESDPSGSTVGGPAVRMWRKALRKSKKKKADRTIATPTSSVGQPVQRIRTRETSEMSDRTSKAETAIEGPLVTDRAQEAGQKTHSIGNTTQIEIDGRLVNLKDEVTPLPTIKTGPGHHLPRTAMRTDEVRSVEDRVWCEALDGGHLPIDAPYTHLAARGDAGFYPSSNLSSPRYVADGSAIELLSADDKAREVQKKKKKHQQQSQRAERIMNMQGGTVLIEFLAGSSRIGASLIRSTGLDVGAAANEYIDEDVDATSTEVENSSGGVAANVLGYVPLLPQHFLSFFGLSTSAQQDMTGNDAVETGSPLAASATSYLSGLRLPTFGGLLSDASDWVTNLLGLNSAASSSMPKSSIVDAEALDDPSKAEEWEYAIPDFDHNSLASTPRPIYRRKRPVPSAMNGFNISAAQTSNHVVEVESQTVPKIESVVPQLRPGKSAGSEVRSANEQRYSILHIDGLGVGRRAFLRGLPELEGMRP